MIYLNAAHIEPGGATVHAAGNRQQSCWLGRVYFLQFLCDKICHVGSAVFRLLNAICLDPIATGDILKKLQEHVLPYIELKKGIPNHFKKLKQVMHSTIAIIDALQIATDIDYFVNSKFKRDSRLRIAGRVALFSAHLATCCYWLVRTPWVRSALIISYACFAFDACCQSFQAETAVQQCYTWLELAKNVADIALNALALAGITWAPFMCVAGCVCIGLGAICVLYKQEHSGVTL